MLEIWLLKDRSELTIIPRLMTVLEGEQYFQVKRNGMMGV